MFTSCPKCGHKPLPSDQSLPAACPARGVILAKVGQPLPTKVVLPAQDKVDPIIFWPPEFDTKSRFSGFLTPRS